MLKTNIKKTLTHILPFICLLWVVIGCGELSDRSDSKNPMNNPLKRNTGTVNGKDYLLVKRFRILDQNGFDRPVEAGSLLVPDGWKVEGGIRWKSLGGCRADVIAQEIRLTSPDGAIQFSILPSETYVASDDQAMQQILETGARSGGCQVGSPFNAGQHLERLASKKLGARAVNIRTDESSQSKIDQFNNQSNSENQQYRLNINWKGSAVYGDLVFNDGTKGLAQVGVSVSIMDKPNMMSGGSTRMSTSTVFHQIFIRYKADREAEALKVFGMITTSHRINPIWAQAKTDFLKQIGDMEHAGNIERIRLVGKQSEAYAKSASEAADAQMRSWEKQQSSSDASHRRYIQTIREVETWKDSSGNSTELNAGYKYGWSKPDGSYILTDNSNFDPAVEFQQNWEKMQKVEN